MDDEMRAVVERCAREGTPRPESMAIRAHSPVSFWSFDFAWNNLFRSGVVDHGLKERCRIYVSRSVKCEYCGNQRSDAARANGLREGQIDELINLESSPIYSDREKAALAYAEAITWRLEPSEAFWERLASHCSTEELVELASFICLTMGQQSWIRLLNNNHHEFLAGTTASMAPGMETAAGLAKAKASDDYWKK